MCLWMKRVRHNEIPGPSVAKVPIRVFKVVQPHNAALYFSMFMYEPHQAYRTLLGDDRLVGVVEQGFHAWTTFGKAEAYALSSTWVDTKVVKFTIPVGAKFYIGSRGDIVSDQIVSGDLRDIRNH